MILGDVEASAKYDIGRKLVKFLTEQTFIDLWLERWVKDAEYWVYSKGAVGDVHTWLKDFDIQQALQDMPHERKWVAVLSQEGVSSITVLTRVVDSVGRLWLDGDRPGWTHAFNFLFGFFNQVSLG